MISAFSTCIWPISPEEFISELRGKSPIHFRGAPSKYASLLDAQELNQVLSRLIVARSVLQVRKDNGSVPDDEVTAPTVNNTRRTIKSQALEQRLKNGATLVFENCESHFQNVHEMCSMPAEVFLARALLSALSRKRPTQTGESAGIWGAGSKRRIRSKLVKRQFSYTFTRAWAVPGREKGTSV